MNTRKVVLDVETTHLDVKEGAIIEIGCVELINDKPTENYFHTYLNPKISVSKESTEITGLTNEMLQNKPIFLQIVHDFLDFIGNSPIIAHNARFDVSYINKELNNIGHSSLTNDVIDTLDIARRKYRQNNTLDGLCKRFDINNTHRIKHGALLDAELLAHVYYFLIHDTLQLDFSDISHIESGALATANVEYMLDPTIKSQHIEFLARYKLLEW